LIVGRDAGVCPQHTRKEAAIRQQQMVFNGYMIFRFMVAKLKYYAVPAEGIEFCFSVSFFSDNFATPLNELTQKWD
jgi:hypothetical protein